MYSVHGSRTHSSRLFFHFNFAYHSFRLGHAVDTHQFLPGFLQQDQTSSKSFEGYLTSMAVRLGNRSAYFRDS